MPTPVYFVATPPPGYAEALGAVIRVSTSSDGAQSDNGSFPPSVTADGTKVAFASSATDLVANTTVAGQANIFVKDLTTGVTTLISAAADGTPGNGPSDGGIISSDGKFVAFNSTASNLVTGGTNASVDVYIKNLATGAITRVSGSSNPSDQGAISAAGNFSADGTKLVFESSAQLTPGDTSPYTDVYVYDLTTGTTTLVSTNGSGVQANSNTLSPVLSPDGTKVAFSSNASNLSPLETSNDQNIYVKDLTTGAVSIASSRSDGTPSQGFNFAPAFSPDGTEVAFQADTDNLVPGDSNAEPDIFVKDLKTGILTRISTAADGTQADNGSSEPNWFPDGTKIIFSSNADNLLPGGSPPSGGIYIKDLLTGDVTLESTAADGSAGNDYSDHPVISGNGAIAAFGSAASNLVAGDTNGVEDIFVKNLVPLLASTTTGSVKDDTGKPSVSTTGRLLFVTPGAVDPHTVTVTGADGDLGTLAATLTKNAGVGTTGLIDWTYQVSRQEAASVPLGSEKVDTFTVKVDDGLGGTAEQTVSVTVIGANPDAAPVPHDDAYKATSGATLVVPVKTGVLANDTDPDAFDTLSAALVTGPTHGALTLAADGSFSYTPVAGYVGKDSFTYAASDGLLSTTATAVIDVGKLTKSGPETLVDPAPSSAQYNPQIAGLAAGGYVVAWSDQSPAPVADFNVKAQIFDGSGHQVGTDLLVNTVTSGFQSGATVAALSGGGFVVAWNDDSGIGGDADSFGIKARLFDATGAAVSSEFLVNAQTAGSQLHPTVTGLANGGFVVAWDDSSGIGGDTSLTGIKARLFDATGAAVSPEILVNAQTKGSQLNPRVTALADGGFVATWVDSSGLGGDTSNTGIKAQVFDAAGNKRGGEILVNTSTNNTQDEPTILGLAGGGFVASWTDYGGNQSYSTVRAQVFDATGAKVGSELTLSPGSFDRQDSPSLASLPTGGFVVSWAQNGYAGAGSNVQGQEFTASGVPIGPNFTVNAQTPVGRGADAIGGLTGGGIAVAWADYSSGSASPVIKTQVLDVQDHNTAPVATDDAYSVPSGGTLNPTEALGLLSNDTDVNVTDALTASLVTGPGHGAVTVNGDGSFVYTPAPGYVGADSFVYRASDGTDGTDAKVSLTVGNDTRLGAEGLVNTVTSGDQSGPTVTALANGSYVVMWQDASGIGGDADATAIKGQLYDATGAKVSGEFLVNGLTKGQQIFPEVAARPDGGFVATWADASGGNGDASGFGIQANTFGPDGSFVPNSQFLVNTTTAGDQVRPDVAALANDDFVVTWTDTSGTGGDADGDSVKAQVFGAGGNSIGTEFLVNSTTKGDQAFSKVAGLANGGFVIAWEDYSANFLVPSIKAQIFDASGNRVGAEFAVFPTSTGTQSQAVITPLANGNFVVSGTLPDGSGAGVEAQVFSAAGARVGAPVLVNTHTSSDQYASSITATSDGGFVVTWTDGSLSGGDASGSSVKAQAFDASGTKVGTELRVDAATAGDQYASAVAALSGDRFVVAFEDNGGNPGDVSGTSIREQIVGLTTGVAEDGTIGGATVAYANGSGAAATTDDNGNFDLSGGTGSLVLTGGTDTATGLAFTGRYTAPEGSSVLSPLTTLVETLVEMNGETVASADAAVIAALGLTAGTDLTTLDAVAGTKAGDAAATAVFKAGAAVQDILSLIQAAGGSADAAIAALAAKIVAGPVNLGAAATVSAIAQGAGLDQAKADAIGKIVSDTAAALADQLKAATAADRFIDITGASIALQGDAAAILKGLSTDDDFTAAATTFEQNLNQTLAAADQRAADTAPCYGAGTRILTDGGEIAVEDLAAGDFVVTASGERRPIVWLGRRHIDLAHHPRPDLVRPVRIEAGALGDDLPKRDLLVSPEHALWLDDRLVPAGELINGATIRQEHGSAVDYFHVELDSHDILLAEGVPAESYLDCDNRSSFDNAPGDVVALHPSWSTSAANRSFASRALAARLRACFAARARDQGRGRDLVAYEARQRARGMAGRTNVLRNPRGEGAVPGRLGAGGQAPTHWWCDAPRGIDIEVLGSGGDAGLPSLELRLVGGADAGGRVSLCPEPGNAAPAACGQDWTVSCHLRHTGGSLDGVRWVNLYVDERTADASYLTGQAYPQPMPTGDDLWVQRLSATRRIIRREAAAMTAYVQIEIEAGAAIDMTWSIAAPQIEQGDYASDPLLPPPGEFGPTTRQSHDGDGAAPPVLAQHSA